MKTKSIAILLVSLCMATTGHAQHGWAAESGILLDECPTKYGEYSAKAIVNDYRLEEVRVFRNGRLFQTIRPEDEDDQLAAPVYEDSADKLIHFPDANNDGYRDIFIGLGGSRSLNTLFLWNEDCERFELCPSAADLQNVLFCPQEDAIYDGGSGSAWEFYISKSVWVDNELQPAGTLEITTDLAEYNRTADPEYRKTHAYILTDARGKVKKTNRQAELPATWRQAIKMLMR